MRLFLSTIRVASADGSAHREVKKWFPVRGEAQAYCELYEAPDGTVVDATVGRVEFDTTPLRSVLLTLLNREALKADVVEVWSSSARTARRTSLAL